MGAGVVSWDWWDGGEQSVVGTLMRGHARPDRTNIADVHLEDPDHLSTATLPPVHGFGDEHGDNELVRQLVGGVRWVAGEGHRSDCAT